MEFRFLDMTILIDTCLWFRFNAGQISISIIFIIQKEIIKIGFAIIWRLSLLYLDRYFLLFFFSCVCNSMIRELEAR